MAQMLALGFDKIQVEKSCYSLTLVWLRALGLSRDVRIMLISFATSKYSWGNSAACSTFEAARGGKLVWDHKLLYGLQH